MTESHARNSVSAVSVEHGNAPEKYSHLEMDSQRPSIFCDHWVLLSVGILTELGSGSAYAISIISDEMKEILNYTQSELSLVSSVGDVGMFCGVVAGTLYPLIGPRKLLILGGLCSLLGFLMMYLFVTETVSSNVSAMCFFYFLATLGNNLRASSATAVIIGSFPVEAADKLVGLTKGNFALGASLFSLCYQAFFDSISPYLVFTICFIIFLVIIALPFYSPASKTAPEDKPNEIWSYFLFAVAFAVCVLIFSFVQYFHDVPKAWKIFGVCCAFAILAGMVVRPIVRIYRYRPEPIKEVDSEISCYSGVMTPDGGVVHHEESRSHSVQEDVPSRVWKTVMTLDFYLVFFASFILSGSGVVVNNNLAQIRYAFAGTTTDTLHVSLWGIGNFIGRTGLAALSGYLGGKKYRLWILAGSCLIMAMCHFVLMTTNDSVLLPITFICSVCYGGCFAIVPAFCAARYGTATFAENYGAFDIAPASGSLFFATFVINQFYTDVEVNGETEDCSGSSCFGGTFLVCGCCSLFAVCLTLIQIWRERRAAKNL